MMNAWLERKVLQRLSCLGGQAWLDALNILEEGFRAKHTVILLTDAHAAGISDLDLHINQRFKKFKV